MHRAYRRIVLNSIRAGSVRVSFTVLPDDSDAGLPVEWITAAFPARGIPIAGLRTSQAVSRPVTSVGDSVVVLPSAVRRPLRPLCGRFD